MFPAETRRPEHHIGRAGVAGAIVFGIDQQLRDAVAVQIADNRDILAGIVTVQLRR